MGELALSHRIRFDHEEGLLAFGLTPGFAINQRALVLPTDIGNIMWECVSLVTDDAIQVLKARGGVTAIAVSHPHFYSSMVAWSEALGEVPIYIHEADRAWVGRASNLIEFWHGEELQLSRDVKLLRLGGHFEGNVGLHWQGFDCPQGYLFPGDAVQVTMDRRWASFMYSYPNAIPMKRSDVARLRNKLAHCDFDSIFGFTWGRNIVGGAKAAFERSVDRYMAAVCA